MHDPFSKWKFRIFNFAVFVLFVVAIIRLLISELKVMLLPLF